MNVKMLLGIIVIIAGLLGVAASASADYTGLNLTQPEDSRDEAAFGWVQGVLCAVGGLILIAGIAVIFISTRKKESPQAPMAQNPYEEHVSGPVIPAEQLAQVQPAQESSIAYQQPVAPQYQAPALTADPNSQGELSQTDVESLQENDLGDLDSLYADLNIESATGYECPDCGDSLEPGAKTCPTCGAVFEEPQNSAMSGAS